MNLPEPGKEILLGVKSLENGGCTLKGSTFYLKKPGRKAKLTREQIEQLETLGYL